jgi:hypothetical protein
LFVLEYHRFKGRLPADTRQNDLQNERLISQPPLGVVPAVYSGMPRFDVYDRVEV